MIPGAENESERSRFLSLILREVARMQHLLSAVREISVIDAQLEGEERHPVDVGELLNNLIEAHRLRRLPEAQSVAVNLSVQSERSARSERSEPGYPIKVLTAPQRLTQVLENLLENALAFSPPGKEVTISLARERGRAVIRFEDRGPGIPEQHLEKIFQRFFSYRPQAESVDAPSTGTVPASTASGHLGLGLAISRAIVEGYGGTIAASNRPRGGACFEVRLPLTGG